MNHKYLIIFLLFVMLSIFPASAITVDNTTHYVLNLSNITITNPETSNFSAIVVQSDYVYFQGADYKTYTFSFLPIIANYTYGIFIVNENGLAIATTSNATGYATLNYIPSSNATANFSIYAISYCVDTTVCGYVLSAQGLDGIDASVNLWNASYNVNITSNISTGYYIFTNISNGTYNINASKPGYGTVTDTVTVSGYGFKILVLYPQYSLTVYVRDVNSNAYLSPFFVNLNNTITSWETNPANYSILNYGIYTISVSTTGYYPQTQTILLSGNQTIFFDLSLVASGTVFKTLPHDVKFIVQDIFGTTYPGVNVSVQGYNTTTGSGWTWLQKLLGIDFEITPIQNATMSGNTGSDGAIVFKMMETVYYNVIVTGTNISNSYWLYPADSVYYLTVSAPDYSWQQYDTPVSEGIITTVDKTTTGDINVTYQDILNQTTSLIVYVNNSDSTIVTSWTCSTGCNNTNHNFTIPGYDGNSYFVEFVATHTTYGNYERSYTVVFPRNASITGIPDVAWLFGAILIMVFTGAIFTRSTTELGLLVVAGEGWMFLGLGWFASMDTVQIGVGLSVVTFMGIMAYISKSARDQGMS